MVAEESALRPGLLAGLLAAVRHNSGHRHPWIRLFEIGDVFEPGPGDDVAALPVETERVALVLAHEDDSAETAMQAWRVVADALGIVGVEVVQPDGGLGRESSQPAEHSEPGWAPDRGLTGLHAARSGILRVGGEAGEPAALLGAVGEVDPEVVAAFGLPHQRIGWLEIDVATLAGAPRRGELAEPVSRYPSSDVDLAFAVDDAVAAARVEAILRTAATDLCESVELFDVYRGRGVEEGQRSLAYRLRFCALDHTLTESELAALRQRCIDAVQSALPATLRA
jgi:phenylalanyl-tRNA synthetase beta chain